MTDHDLTTDERDAQSIAQMQHVLAPIGRVPIGLEARLCAHVQTARRPTIATTSERVVIAGVIVSVTTYGQDVGVWLAGIIVAAVYATWLIGANAGNEVRSA